MAQMNQQVSGAAEPGQKHGHAHRIEKREAAAMPRGLRWTLRCTSVMGCSMSSCSMAHAAKVTMSVRQMKVQMQRAAQERQGSKGKAHDKTDQIKEFPVHSFTSFMGPHSRAFFCGPP